jgi:hypothetical protein
MDIQINNRCFGTSITSGYICDLAGGRDRTYSIIHRLEELMEFLAGKIGLTDTHEVKSLLKDLLAGKKDENQDFKTSFSKMCRLKQLCGESFKDIFRINVDRQKNIIDFVIHTPKEETHLIHYKLGSETPDGSEKDLDSIKDQVIVSEKGNQDEYETMYFVAGLFNMKSHIDKEAGERLAKIDVKDGTHHLFDMLSRDIIESNPHSKKYIDDSGYCPT